MSIIDSPEEYVAAQARVADTADQQLERDLVYWATAIQDAGVAHDALVDKERAARSLYAEAQSHVSIIVAEIRKRRDAKRAGADG